MTHFGCQDANLLATFRPCSLLHISDAESRQDRAVLEQPAESRQDRAVPEQPAESRQDRAVLEQPAATLRTCFLDSAGHL